MNIRTLALALAIMPAIASAQYNNSDKDTISNKNTYDTTIVFNKQKYEISQTGERTNVKVYKANGSELEKTLETQYLDGQQVEQVSFPEERTNAKARNTATIQDYSSV